MVGQLLQEIAGERQLGKHQQVGAAIPRLADQLAVLLDVARQVAQFGRHLSERNFHRARLRTTSLYSAASCSARSWEPPSAVTWNIGRSASGWMSTQASSRPILMPSICVSSGVRYCSPSSRMTLPL